MPIYIFHCAECHENKEMILRVKDLAVKQYCLDCGSQLDDRPAPVAKMIRGKGAWSSPA